MSERATCSQGGRFYCEFFFLQEGSWRDVFYEMVVWYSKQIGGIMFGTDGDGGVLGLCIGTYIGVWAHECGYGVG